jgi:hypothetical protein
MNLGLAHGTQQDPVSKTEKKKKKKKKEGWGMKGEG